jgi:hypothetical protein
MIMIQIKIFFFLFFLLSKGGFGSLLRSFGKQINKSTNKDACRDLTGRRIKHVNQEKKLKDFLSKQSELSKQKELERKAKIEKRNKKKEYLEKGHHLFVDPKYDEQKQKIAQDLDHAISNAVSSKRVKLDADSIRNDESSIESKASDELVNEKRHTAILSGVVASIDELKQSKETNKIQTKKSGTTTEKLKDWLGVGDLEVSSSSDEEEPKISQKRKAI